MLIIKVGGEALTMLKSEYGASYGLSSAHFPNEHGVLLR
jgi:hypothetical protein